MAPMTRALMAIAAAGAAAVAAGTPAAVQPEGPGRSPAWSTPLTLARCSSKAPRILFPVESPFHSSGPGAIVFDAGAGCRLGAGPRVAPIGVGDAPGRPRPPRVASGRMVGLAAASAVAATTRGQILLVGPASGRATPISARAGSTALFSEGAAGGPFTHASPLGGLSGPLGLATAYLGDVAVASPSLPGDPGVRVRIQRYFTGALAGPTLLRGPRGAQRALTVALDYRTDALAVWWQDGWLYARQRHNKGRIDRLQRFARAGGDVELATLISDDGRAIAAWMDRGRHSARLYLDISGPDMWFGRPRLLEELRYPDGQAPPDGSVRLVRLSTESVLMAWTGTEHGRFVVKAAGIGLNGVRKIQTISAPASDAVLMTLATGPRGDAVALWSQASGHSAGAADVKRALMASRGVPSSRGTPRFGPPELVASPGRFTGADIAIDPDSDRAVASWRDRLGRIRYALRTEVAARAAAR